MPAVERLHGFSSPKRRRSSLSSLAIGRQPLEADDARLRGVHDEGGDIGRCVTNEAEASAWRHERVFNGWAQPLTRLVRNVEE